MNKIKIKSHKRSSGSKDLIVRAAEETASKDGTIRLIWATGYKDIRETKEGKFYEELDMSPECVDLSYLNSGRANFYIQHEREIPKTLGVVEKAWIEDGVGYADVRLSKRAEVSGYVQDIQDGILRNVSVGYNVNKYTETTEKGDKIRTLIATSWMPKEISIVADAFDPNAYTLRAAEDKETEVEITNKNKEGSMNKEEMLKALQAKLDAGEQLSEEEQKQYDALQAELKGESDLAARLKDVEAREAALKTTDDAAKLAKDEEEKKKKEKDVTDSKVEEERKDAIRSAVKAADLDVSFAETLITRGTTQKELTVEIFNKIKEVKTSNTKEDKKMTKREQAVEALCNRIDAKRFKSEKATNPLKGESFIKIIEAVVERKAGESDSAFAKRAATTTSDLPELLANVAHKLVQNTGSEKFVYDKIAHEQSLRDFKQTPIVQLAGVNLAAKTEGADYATATLVDTDEKMTLAERGILIDISQKAIINDDLSLLKGVANRAGQSGHRDIEAQLFAMLASASGMGPTLSDSKSLFHADHNNSIVAGGLGPTVAGVQEANKKMAAFTDHSGAPLDLRVNMIVCGPDLEFTAKQTASSTMVPNSSSSVNPYAGELEVYVSSRVASGVWYALCDKNEWFSLVYGTLEGMSEPNVETQVDFKSSNLQTKIEYPNTVAVASYKGIVKGTYTP